MKTCNICGNTKELVSFYKNGRYLRPECKDCTDIKQAAAKFNMTTDQLLAMYEQQEGKCAICKKECNINRNLSVDHDHSCCPTKAKSCGKCVRGLLCAHCNHAIGLLREDPEILANAIEYLNSFASRQSGFDSPWLHTCSGSSVGRAKDS